MDKIFNKLTYTQINILIASIIADGEITKLYPGSRRKNNSYREHYCLDQEEYRKWKATFFDGFLYIRPKSHTLASKSDPLFTKLFPYFYNELGKKQIPKDLLVYCTHPYFLAILYLDDGSLSITKRVNHEKQLIYLTPHIYLYLQNYPLEQLVFLKNHLSNIFNITFTVAKRKDGYGYVLKLTKVKDSINFLKVIHNTVKNLFGMDYKYNWENRFKSEVQKLNKEYPNYKVLSSSSERWKNYNKSEIDKIITLKQQKVSTQEIANQLNRTYWSITYKIQELKKDGRLK